MNVIPRTFLLLFVFLAVAGCAKNEEPEAQPLIQADQDVADDPVDADVPATWPRTVDDAAARIIDAMSRKDKATVRNTARENLIRFHHSWGMGIRNSTGLWRGNQELMDDAGAEHPDSASMAIIEEIWQRLQNNIK